MSLILSTIRDANFELQYNFPMKFPKKPQFCCINNELMMQFEYSPEYIICNIRNCNQVIQ